MYISDLGMSRFMLQIIPYFRKLEDQEKVERALEDSDFWPWLKKEYSEWAGIPLEIYIDKYLLIKASDGK